MTIKEALLPKPSVEEYNDLDIPFSEFISDVKKAALDKNEPLWLRLLVLPIAIVAITILKIRCINYKRKNPELFI